MSNSMTWKSPAAFQRLASNRKFSHLLVLSIAIAVIGCGSNSARSGLPSEVESTVSTINENIRMERYDDLYREASELWRQDATLEDSVASFKTLRLKLGEVESRTLQTAKEQENASGPLKGRVYIVVYKTKFENGEAMETFTLVERNGQWKLARYFVSSTALQ